MLQMALERLGRCLGLGLHTLPPRRAAARGERALAANWCYRLLRLAATTRPEDLRNSGPGHIFATSAATGALSPPHQSLSASRIVNQR